MIGILEELLEGPVTVEDLKHKPGRRRTLRVKGPNGTAIVKLYSSDRAPVVAARIAALGAGPREPCVPVVLRAEPRLGMVVLTEVPGLPLRHAILEGNLEACRRAGVVLAAWHAFWRAGAPRVLTPHTLARELEILRERSEAAPAAIASRVRPALASFAGEWPCATVVHRDLYEEQILVGDDVGLIDLDDAALGPPELDVGNLLAHLELLSLRTGRDLDTTVTALLTGYGEESLDSALLDRCRRLSLLRLACIHDKPELVDRALRDATEPARTSASSIDAAGHANTALRIAFYSPRASHLEPALAHGGDPFFLDPLLRALRDRGHDVRVVSHLNVRDLWLRRVPARRLLTEAVAIWRETKRFSPDCWLVYDASRTYPDLFGWWQRPKRYVLFAAHTWQSKRLPRSWRWLFELAFRQSLHRADRVVADRPISGERLRSRGVDVDRLSVVPPAARLWTQIPSRGEARQRLGLPHDVPVALCATRFTGREKSRKGKTEMILDLVDCLASLPPELVLVVAGDGPGRGRIETAAANEPSGRVRLPGAVQNEDLKWFYAACDFYTYPHHLDRPWMSVLEAQACGRPVLTMRTGSAEITTLHGRTGLLARDLDEFRRHMAALANDRARCEVMGEAAAEYIAEFHSIEVRARQVERWLSPSDGASDFQP